MTTRRVAHCRDLLQGTQFTVVPVEEIFLLRQTLKRAADYIMEQPIAEGENTERRTRIIEEIDYAVGWWFENRAVPGEPIRQSWLHRALALIRERR